MQDAMPREKVASAVMWLGELFQVGVYKRSQGKIARQITFAALAITFALAAWSLSTHRMWLPTNVALILAGLLLVGGLWISFRVVNIPRFADFLIAVEAEMNKVSWPSKTELIRSAMVVIFVLFFLTVVLFGFDLVWGFLFEQIGILKKSS
jgi:preprotein translocase subunit SecE